MSLLLDGIVLLIILLCFFAGWRRGAAITLLNFVALVAAFTVAVLLSPSLSNSIYETFFKSSLSGSSIPISQYGRQKNSPSAAKAVTCVQ